MPRGIRFGLLRPVGRHGLRGVPADRFPGGEPDFRIGPDFWLRPLDSFLHRHNSRIGLPGAIRGQEARVLRRHGRHALVEPWGSGDGMQDEPGRRSLSPFAERGGLPPREDHVRAPCSLLGNEAVRSEPGQLRGMHGERLPAHATDFPDERGEGREIQEGIQILQGYGGCPDVVRDAKEGWSNKIK